MNYGRALQDIVILRSPKRQVNTGEHTYAHNHADAADRQI